MFEKVKTFVDYNAVKPIFYRAVKLALINIAGIFLAFLANYIIIHLAGEKVYGDYSIINVWANLFVVIVIFGFDDLFITVVPRQMQHNGALLPIFSHALKVCFFVFLLIAISVFLLTAYKLLPPVIGEYRLSFLMLLAFMSVFALLLAFFRGMNVIARGQILEKLVRPALVLVGILSIFFFQRTVSLGVVLNFQISSIVILCVLLLLTLRTAQRGRMHSKVKYKPTGHSNLIFLAISLLYLLSTRLDLIMLSGQVAPQEVGYYNIAVRIADIVGYPLTAINLIVHTLLSKEFAGEKKHTIYLSTVRISLFAFFLTTLAFLLMLFFGRTVLGVFGEAYTLSFVPLLILASSHLFYALALPYNALFMVSRNERYSLLTLAVNVLTTLALAFFLVPAYAAKGAAFSILGGSIVYMFVTLSIVYPMYRQNKVQRAMTSK